MRKVKKLDSDKTQPAKTLSNKDLAVIEAASSAPLYVRPSPDQIEALAVRELEYQNAVNNVLRDHVLKESHDYGPSDPRSNKNTLLKPGAEKLVRFFKTHVEFEADNELHLQFGGPKNVACMKCRIIDNATGAVLGEGHGACRTGEQARDENKAIKQAKKRALVDAALYAFCLSEFFTQDMDPGAYTAKMALQDRKKELLLQAEAHRKGTVSKVSARMWIVELAKAIFQGRKSLYTIGECDEVFRQFANFDKDTGFALGSQSEKPKEKTEAAPSSQPAAPKAPAGEAKPTAEPPLVAAKRKLWKTIEAARKGVSSSLSDGDFVKAVAQAVYGREALQSVAECECIMDVFTDHDLATGERIPD
jgi:hypothetical protein